MHQHDYGYPDPADVTPEVQAMLDADREMERRLVGRLNLIYEDQVKFKEWAAALEAFWAQLRKCWFNLRAAWPGPRIVIVGNLPRRVWHVSGPPGSGPSGETPEEAAEWVKNDSDPVNSGDPEGGPVEFTEAELHRLWWPGARIERNGWSITCTLVKRGTWGLYEWGGY